MEKAKQGFSQQYLKQVHEEWLYVQSVEARLTSASPSAERAEPRYAFHFEVPPEGPKAPWL
ncbi:MAG: hypothetical protein ACM31P_20385 [Actinomycetota bacterium]